MGAGRTELVRTLFGVDPMDSGELYVRGERIHRPTPEACIRKGMAFVTEDRRLEGLLMPKPVRDNLILVKLRGILKRLGVIDRSREGSLTRSIIADLQVKVAESGRQPVASLSGGNQQKVVIGKWMLNGPRIFIMDEPTRGVDVGAKFEIYSIMCEMAAKGSAHPDGLLGDGGAHGDLRPDPGDEGRGAGGRGAAHGFRPEAIGSLAL